MLKDLSKSLSKTVHRSGDREPPWGQPIVRSFETLYSAYGIIEASCDLENYAVVLNALSPVEMMNMLKEKHQVLVKPYFKMQKSTEQREMETHNLTTPTPGPNFISLQNQMIF